MQVKKGKRLRFALNCKDENGDAITNLASATAIYFQLKINKTDSTPAANITTGAMEVDTPTIGSVRITLTPSITSALSVGSYYMGFQIQYGTDNPQEPDLFENYKNSEILTVLQNIV